MLRPLSLSGPCPQAAGRPSVVSWAHLKRSLAGCSGLPSGPWGQRPNRAHVVVAGTKPTSLDPRPTLLKPGLISQQRQPAWTYPTF